MAHGIAVAFTTAMLFAACGLLAALSLHRTK
jgi:hypothetical protein